jgi:hypothetical protein
MPTSTNAGTLGGYGQSLPICDREVDDMPKTPRWERVPNDDDFGAAARYLSLLMPPAQSATLASSLQGKALVQHRANDLLRASGLTLLTAGDPEVAKNLKKVKHGKKLSPILLIRGDIGDAALTVADGYHRICASYHIDPDSDIPCCIGDLVV